MKPGKCFEGLELSAEKGFVLPPQRCLYDEPGNVWSSIP